MSDVKEILRQRVRERLEATGLSPHSVSKAIGANPGYVRDLLDPEKTGVPSAARLQALATELQTTTDYLMGRADTGEQLISEVTFRDAPMAWRGQRRDGIPVRGSGYCDDLAVQGDDGSELQVERVQLQVDTAVRYIERPPALWAAQDAYAIYFHGDSMEPRFYQGEIGVVDPRRPPSPGDDVVVQLTNGVDRDVVTVLVKQLVRTTSAYVELRQFNPPMTFRVPRRQVARLHRICTRNELLGG